MPEPTAAARKRAAHIHAAIEDLEAIASRSRPNFAPRIRAGDSFEIAAMIRLCDARALDGLIAPLKTALWISLADLQAGKADG
jgi:hypothetical protein